MSVRPTLLLCFAALGAWAALASPQACHDRDGDRENAGPACEAASDCDDGQWDVRPGVPEDCDGIDTNCDGAIDETCDRYCDTPDEYDVPRMLEFGDMYPSGDLYLPECAEFFPGGFLGMTETGTDTMRYLTLRAFDAHGQPLGEPRVIDSAPVENWLSFSSLCDVARGDGRHLVLWYPEFVAPTPRPFLARVVDRFGSPIGPVLDITALSDVATVRAVTEWNGVFNGTDFAVFWTPGDVRTNELLMTTIGYDGTPESVHTVLVTDDVDGKRSLTSDVRSVWTGERYVVALTAGENADIVTLAVDRDGSILAGPHIFSLGSHTEEMVMDEGGPVAVLLDQEATHDVLQLLRLDPITAAARTGGPASSVLPSSELLRISGARLAWNGEMLGVVASAQRWNGTVYEHAIWFWRMLSDGTLLDPLGIKLDDGANWRDTGVRKIGWNGHEFQFIGKYANMKLARASIVCECGDADGDQFDACATDCYDGDPLINGLGTEVCTGGVDDDCDFLIDCADPDCPAGPGPPAIADLAWSAGGLVWSAGSGAQRWDLARGLISDVLRRENFELAECAGRELTAPFWPDDGRLPPLDDALWYLVRPEGDPCARGPWSADGTPRFTLVCD